MADRKLPELRTRIRLDTSDLDKADSRIARFTRSFGDTKAMAGYQAKLKGIGDQADEVGSKLTRNLTLPIAAAGAVSVKLASDFNKSFTTMTSLAGVTTEELAGLKDEVKELASVTGQSPQDLAEALYFLRSSGLEGAEAMDALEASAKGAAIGLGTTSVVADAASSAVNAYGSENLTAAEAVDQLAAAVAAGKGEAAAFAPQIGQLLPLAKRLGVEFSEVAGAMAYFTQTGTPAAQAATMVQGILQKLIGPTEQGRKVLEDYGVSLDVLRSTVSNQGLLAGLQLLNDGLGGDSEALKKVFDDVEGFNGVLGLLNNNGRDAAAVLDQVADSSETVAEAFARVQGTDEFKAQQAITDLQVAAIELGQTLIPIVTDLAEGVSGIASAFASLPQPVQTALLGLAGLAAVIGPLAKGFGLATQGVSLLLKVASSKSVVGLTQGVAGLGGAAADSSGKIGALVSAIGPTGVAAGVAGAGLLAFAITDIQQNAADAQANIDSMVAALEQGGTPAEVIGKKIAATLNDAAGGFQGIGGSSKDLKKDLEDAGVSVTELRDLLLGSDSAFESFAKGLKDQALEDGDPFKYDVLIANLERFRSEADGAKATFEGQKNDLKTLGIETDGAADSTGGLADEQQNLIGPTEEATDALQEEADAARSLFDAHRAVSDSAEGVADAQAALADARRAAAPGSKENRDALEAIVDAEEAIRDAQRDGVEAQDDLTKARAAAREEVDDLTLSLERAKQTETEAATAIERARSDALKAKSPLEQREAADRIKAAELALREAREETGETADALAKARDIANTDAVVSAQERITSAREAEQEAQERLAEATTAAAELRKAAAEKVQEASENLTEAELDHIDAQAEVIAQTDGVGESTDVLIVRLTNLANKLAPNDPLRQNLDAYIEKLRELRGLEGGNGINDTGRTGGAAPGTVVSTGQITGGGPLPTSKALPSPTETTPEGRTGNDARPGSQGNVISVPIEITVTGQPDAQTLAQLREVATEATETALRRVAVG